MRNLAVSAKIALKWEQRSSKSIVTLTDEGPVSYENGQIYLHTREEQKLVFDLADTILQEGSSVASDPCSGMAYLSDGRLVLSFQSGLLVARDVGLNNVEVVGNLPCGIQGIWKSPDDEILVLAAKDGAIILMTSRDFEPLMEFYPYEATDAAFANVNVGWGAKETQFHGRAGKAAREIVEEVVPVAENENQAVFVDWRDDGLFFAISYVSPSDQIRKVRVFNREGQLQSTSELVSNLAPCLSWKTFRLITSSMSKPNGSNVIGFFEKNGLRHGEFDLPVESRVKMLVWNSDASILAAHIVEEKSGNDVVQLWVASNYNWQLKKTWTQKDVLSVMWDPMTPMSFFIFSAHEAYEIKLKWKIHHSGCKVPTDKAFVGVINGKALKMTPFRQMVVPPPMSAFELHFDSYVSSVTFSPDLSMAVITEDNEVFICEETPNLSAISDEVKITGAGGAGFIPKCDLYCPSMKLKLGIVGCELSNWSWFNHCKAIASNEDKLFVIDMQTGAVEATLTCEAPVYDTAQNYIFLDNGAVARLNKNNELEPVDFELPEGCTNEVSANLIFSLNDRSQRFYINGKEVATGVNSFFIHSDFVMITTVKHMLRSIPLKSIVNQDAAQISWTNESVRALERGSRLVLAVSEDARTMLQMPRGNLEVIYPRALSLHILKKLLDQCMYKEAITIMRRQRINMNLIVDHNFDIFKSNALKFIREAPTIDSLCVFIADLMDEDVTSTMYESMYKDADMSSKHTSMKVDQVCSILLKNMAEERDKYVLPIISCLVRSSKSKIDDALIEIKRLKDENKHSKADEALSFLLLLVNVNVLYEVALGLYDFELVLYVAERSQKDPKEYVPFLNELKRLPEDYKKYKIDVYLKRFSSALRHIAQCGSDYLEECLTLVKSQRLYLEAIPLFIPKSQGHSEVCRAYGEYLATKKYYEDSALIYEAGGMDIEAVASWEQSNNWRYCLALGKRAVKPASEFTALCRRVIEKLKEAHRFREASQIFVEYLNDPEEAFLALVQGHEWDDAMRLVFLHDRPDLYETHLKPALMEFTEVTISNLGKKATLFQEYLSRLLTVVQMKENVAAGNYDEADINVEDADLYSEAASQADLQSLSSRAKSNSASLKTRVSNRSKSSRSRRKQELKKYSTKEGSKFEDLGLFAALHDLISQIYASSMNEVGQLTRVLCKYGFVEHARSLQQKLISLDSAVAANESVIWNPAWFEGQANLDGIVFGPNATTEDVVNRATQVSTYRPDLSILEPRFRFPPKRPTNNDWMLQILM